MRLRRSLSCLAVAALTLAFGVTERAEAQPGVAQSQVVSAVPASYTPNLDGGVVFSIAQVGTWIVAGGSFTSTTPHGSTTAVATTGVVAFDQSTGALDSGFMPAIGGGQVDIVYPGPTAGTVYVGGHFGTVNGVYSKGLALLSLSTGAVVAGFKTPSLNGVVYSMRVSGGRLYLTGSFTTVGGVTHDGLATLNPTTGALDPFMNIQLTGHHNYNGSGADGPVGGRSMDISPDGSRAIVIGNFKDANGVVHDQIVMLDLTGSSAVIDPNWNTSAFSGRCASGAFDTYIEDVAFSPDGSYFAIAATGGGGISKNIDGTRSLCDSASRWSTTDTGTNVQPTWVDYTGNDSFWSVAVTGTAIYEGGHARWINNPLGSDSPGAGSVPRPGIIALDPASGLPLKWNPGRNPRGAGAYALLATPQGLYVGSDTNYIGNFQYKHDEIAFFPLTGGYVPASTTTASLPANVYETGPLSNAPNTKVSDLAYRSYSGSTIGQLTTVPNTGIDWSTTRGAFMLGSTVFYGSTDGKFYSASFNGTTVGTPVVIDPYQDPAWDNVQTGSGQTYEGVLSNFYSEIPNVTGAFYSDGRMYYSLLGKSTLFWRYFTPDSGTIGGTEFTVSGGNFSNTAGEFLSGSTLYYANRADGTLHTVSFSNGGTNGANPRVDPTTDKTVSGPAIDGNDWRARSLFAFGSATGPSQPPVASASGSCNGVSCTFDGSGSSAPGSTIASYAWTFGDGATGTGEYPTHGYATPGTYSYTLTVTNAQGVASPAFTGSVTATASTGAQVGFVAEAGYNGVSASPSVVEPTGVGAGDVQLLYVTAGTAGVTTSVPTGLSGWQQIAQKTNSTLETTVFERVAVAGDSGARVTVPLTASTQVDLELVDYSGASSAAPVMATGADSNTATHVAPSVSVAAGGSWVVSYWGDRTSNTTVWSLPSSVTSRAIGYGTKGGHTDTAVADSGALASGTYPSQSASGGAVAGRGNTISIVLVPSS